MTDILQFILIFISLTFLPVSYLISFHVAERRAARRRHSVQRVRGAKSSVTVVQDGRKVGFFIDHGREYASVILDSDAPLTKQEQKEILRDIARFKEENCCEDE
jgi:hypothetical protein